MVGFPQRKFPVELTSAILLRNMKVPTDNFSRPRPETKRKTCEFGHESNGVVLLINKSNTVVWRGFGAKSSIIESFVRQNFLHCGTHSSSEKLLIIPTFSGWLEAY